MVTLRPAGRIPLSCTICAGVAAGIAATVAQVLLWLAFTTDFPAILYRDARFTAALVLGRGVLPPPAAFHATVWVAATLVHFGLSIVYAAVLLMLVERLPRVAALGAGALFGVVLYGVNLYGCTEIFPWFAEARGWITLAAHLAFGLTAAAVQCRGRFSNGQSRRGGH